MTEGTPEQSPGRYHLEQFLARTTPSERRDLLDDYKLYADAPTPKAFIDRATAESLDVEPNTAYEEIAVTEARKRNLLVTGVETRDSSVGDVVEEVVLRLKTDGVEYELSFVAARSDDSTAPDVDEDYFRRSVESILRTKQDELQQDLPDVDDPDDLTREERLQIEDSGFLVDHPDHEDCQRVQVSDWGHVLLRTTGTGDHIEDADGIDFALDQVARNGSVVELLVKGETMAKLVHITGDTDD